MIPPHPFHAWGARFFSPASGGSRLLGPASGGWLGGLSAFALGAVAAGFVLSMIKHREPRIVRAFGGGISAGGKTLEELIAEKEHLEDLIAEVAAREGKL